MGRLQEKVVVITGGASGFGKASAIEFAKLGCKVVLADVNDPDHVVKEINEKGGKCLGFKCDVTKTEDIKKLFVQIEKFGGVDILLNNAGIAGDPQTGESGFYIGGGDKWKKIIDVNLIAVIEMTQYCIAQMRKQKQKRGGTIINVASMAAIIPMDATPVYCASKSGVLHFSKSLVGLLKTDNIRVVTICPSFSDTPLISSMKEQMKAITGGILSIEDIVTGIVELALDKENRGTGAVMTVTVNNGREYPPKYNPRNSKL